jgi:excisionase family DNA binding protein
MVRAMDEREYRTAAEVAADLGVSLRTVRRWIADGQLPAVRIGRSVRVPRSAYAGVLEPAAGAAASAAAVPGAVAVPVVWRHMLRGPSPQRREPESAAQPGGADLSPDLAEARRRAAEGMDRRVPRGRPPAGKQDTADALLDALRAGSGVRLVDAASLPASAGSSSSASSSASSSPTSGSSPVAGPVAGAPERADVLQVAGRIVLDASVILRWLLRGEDDAARALALRERIVAGAVQAVVPPHLPLEIADALRSAAEHGRISQMAVLPLLRAVESLRLEVADPWGHAADSLAAARELGVGVGDAACLVSARRSGATLVTANPALRDAAAASGDSVAWLGDIPA